jgi:hypothetical protein
VAARLALARAPELGTPSWKAAITETIEVFGLNYIVSLLPGASAGAMLTLAAGGAAARLYTPRARRLSSSSRRALASVCTWSGLGLGLGLELGSASPSPNPSQ